MIFKRRKTGLNLNISRNSYEKHFFYIKLKDPKWITCVSEYDAYYEDYSREDRENGVYLTPSINKNILAQDGSIR